MELRSHSHKMELFSKSQTQIRRASIPPQSTARKAANRPLVRFWNMQWRRGYPEMIGRD
jgi:hypothetical protein